MRQLFLISALITSIFLLSSCGGSSNGIQKDIYDASSYSSSQIDNTNLTGTWLLVMKYDIEFRGSWHYENEYRHSISSQRIMISIIDNGSELIAYSDLNECCYVSLHHPWRRSNDELIIPLRFGYFVGQISNSSTIHGNIAAELDNPNWDDGNLSYIKVNSGSAGLVKLSSQPSIDGEKALDSWGDITSSFTASSEGTPYKKNDFSINAFSEEEYTWRVFEDGEMTAENHIYELQAPPCTQWI